MDSHAKVMKRRGAFLVLALLAALLTGLGTSPAGAAPVSDVVIAAGKSGNGNSHIATGSVAETFLENAANFGPTGTVVVDSLTITGSTTTVDATYLTGVDIYFDGWIWDSDSGAMDSIWTAGEIDALDTWVTAGGVIIVNDDFGTADELSTRFGATLADATEDGVYTQVNGTHPIVDGPFGTWTNQTTCGLSGQFGTLTAPWTVVANDDAVNSAIAVRAWGDGFVILTGDEGLFRNDGACTADTTFIGNVFAYAHGLTDDGITPLGLNDPGDQASVVGADIGTLSLTTTGGDASPITYDDTQGPLPDGLTLNTATGDITGAATAVGTTTVIVRATDNTGASSATFDWVVSAVDLTPVAAPDEGAGTVGVAFSLDLCANDTLGNGVNTAMPTGTVPPGTAISVCTLAGTPTTAGNYQFTYILTDEDNDMSASVTVDVAIAAADPVMCGGSEATIVGTDGDDVLEGTDGPDVIHGLGGNDEISGLGGDDIICGGGGADDLRGNGGDDTIIGSRGADTIFGGRGADIIFGNNGSDTIFGSGGADVIRGGAKADTIFGNNGTDDIRGGRGNDTISGGKKADILRGQGGNDTIAGNRGNDDMRGGAGTDTCVGGPGVNTSRSCES